VVISFRLFFFFDMDADSPVQTREIMQHLENIKDLLFSGCLGGSVGYASAFSWVMIPGPWK